MDNIEGAVNIKEERKGDVLILRPKGRLDAITAPSMELQVFNMIIKGHTKILLDLKSVDYLSSAGMRMLLSINKKLRGVSGKMILCSITPNVMDVLKMSGFDHILLLCQTEEEALAQLALPSVGSSKIKGEM